MIAVELGVLLDQIMMLQVMITKGGTVTSMSC